MRWKNDAKAALTFSFDDGYTETYYSTIPHLVKYGVSATYNIIVDYVGRFFEGIQTISWEEWMVASANYGVEIASHSLTHKLLTISVLDAFTYNLPSIKKHTQLGKSLKYVLDNLRRVMQIRNIGVELDKEIVSSKKIIEKSIPMQRTLSFIYPGGCYDLQVKKHILLAGYTSARTTIDGLNTLPHIDLYELKAKTWAPSTKVEDANDWVDDAIEKRAWLIEVYHLVSDDNQYRYKLFTKTDDFVEHLRYVASKNVWVDSQQKIVDWTRNNRH